MLNITDDYTGFTNCTNNEKKDITIIVKDLIVPIPCSTILVCLICLVIYTLIKPIKKG